MIEKSKKKKYIQIALLLMAILFILSILIIFITNKENIPFLNLENTDNTDNVVIDKNGTIIDDDIIGVLSIPKINLVTNVKDGTDLGILDTAPGHFEGTAYNQGNIGIAGHNSGNNKDFFKDLNQLEINDTIIYNNNFCERTYKVNIIKEINETDCSYLQPSSNNLITLITCVKGKKDLRLVVQAVEEL